MPKRDEIIKRLMEVKNLPTLPQVVIKLQEMLSSPETSAGKVAEALSSEPAIASNVLRLANSALYGNRKTAEVRDAIVRLGFNEVYGLVIASATLRLFKGVGSIDYAQFWRHSITVAFTAKALREVCSKGNISASVASDAFSAGLLHDIGILIMDQYMPDIYHDILKEAVTAGVPLDGIEHERLGLTHAEIGGIAVRRWNLPESVAEGVEAHHSPHEAKAHRAVAQLVHIANFSCCNQGICNGVSTPQSGFFDEAWDALGIPIDRIEWIIESVKKETEKSPIMMALA